jgi:hypothetical protein
MLIRCGYEIILTCRRPSALVCLVFIHEDRTTNILKSFRVWTYDMQAPL